MIIDFWSLVAIIMIVCSLTFMITYSLMEEKECKEPSIDYNNYNISILE